MMGRNLCIALVALLSLPALASAQNRPFYNSGGVGLYNPIIDVVNTGTSTVVQPIVSHDRKYVTIVGTYQASQLVRLETFPVSGFSTGFVGGAQPPQGNGPVPDINALPPAAIQLPIVRGVLLRQAGMVFVAPLD